MRVVVVGATGNVGTSLLRVLADAAEVDSVVGIARRVPPRPWPKTEWRQADITRDDLTPHFQGAEAASEIRRYFGGPFVPGALLRPSLIPIVPALDRLRFQAVHSLDVGEAYMLAVTRDVRGAFNIAADPVLDPDELGRLLGARPVKVPAKGLRLAVDATWRLHLQPTPPGWVDMALAVPLLDTTRAREELGWRPRRSAGDALLELLGGIRDSAGVDTPPLSPATSGPLRVREVLTGIGRENP